MAKTNGGDLVVRTLRNASVEKIFGLHGAHIDTIFQACANHGVEIIDTRHEMAAGHAAEGYARHTNTFGVAIVTAAGGFTNVITSIGSAFIDQTPVIYLAGSPSLSQLENNGLQSGTDNVALAAPVTKWAHRVSVTQDIPRIIAQAIRVATSAPTGPVLIDLPWDVLTGLVDESDAVIPDKVLVDSRAGPRADQVKEALDLLTRAERPVIMAGVGAYRSGAAELLREFAERAGVPVYSDYEAHGMLPSDHPLYGGTFHKMADLAEPGGRPDFVLALGARFGLFTMGSSDMIVPHEAVIVDVENDAREISLVRKPQVGIVADPGETLKALLGMMDASRMGDWRAWRDKVAEAKRRHRELLEAESAGERARIHPYRAAAAIIGAATPETVIVSDGAEAFNWVNEVIAQDRPGSYLPMGFWGTIGLGLGVATGVQANDRTRPVLLVVGDGSIGFTIAEFDTLVRNNLPVVVAVMNNRSWGASQHFQEMVFGADSVRGTRLGEARYDIVAQGFGCMGRHVTELSQVGPAVAEALRARRPACINVEIDLEPVAPEYMMLMNSARG